MNVILQTLFAALSAFLSLVTLDELITHGFEGSVVGLSLLTIMSSALYYILNTQHSKRFMPLPQHCFFAGCLYFGAYLAESVLSGLTFSHIYMPLISGGCFYLYTQLAWKPKTQTAVFSSISRETGTITVHSVFPSSSQAFAIQDISALTIDDGYLIVDTAQNSAELTVLGSREEILKSFSQLLSSEEQDQIALHLPSAGIMSK
ncbi:hypothetical protein [Veronia pacifica]|uniref:hypothetical protein n=1 Tax=Veronia pacifica TaxID=1080227 RepID=UPI000B1B6980|nr:hypothetical protein [Veronia pacifica]